MKYLILGSVVILSIVFITLEPTSAYLSLEEELLGLTNQPDSQQVFTGDNAEVIEGKNFTDGVGNFLSSVNSDIETQNPKERTDSRSDHEKWKYWKKIFQEYPDFTPMPTNMNEITRLEHKFGIIRPAADGDEGFFDQHLGGRLFPETNSNSDNPEWPLPPEDLGFEGPLPGFEITDPEWPLPIEEKEQPSIPTPGEIEVLKNKLAKLINVDPEDIQIESIEKVDWPDSALGYEEPNKGYYQVITPGHKIVVKAGDKQYEIHTAGDTAKVKIDGKVHTLSIKGTSEEENNNVEKKSDTIREVAKKLKDIKNKIRQFYNVDDLAELGEYGEKLKELLNQKIPENAENIKIVENFGKDGKYTLEITYEVQESDDFRSKNVIALEGEWKGQEGNLPVVTLTPKKLSFKKFPLEGGMIGGGVIEEFIFNSEGIEYNLIW